MVILIILVRYFKFTPQEESAATHAAKNWPICTPSKGNKENASSSTSHFQIFLKSPRDLSLHFFLQDADMHIVLGTFQSSNSTSVVVVVLTYLFYFYLLKGYH